ncbi:MULTISPECIES: GDCCVxC domain-containing (seleno)protein [Ramlibacter]|uniref:Uncharacterized protein n=1 Tax=Ramlibacter pinisoli TaxID=2682844 RepID=A0A6N8IZ13_9BURK|nr:MULTISPECIES: GDCCVxC domain-containing (seleno)protein [Ramlibacter]MVQ31825.1 hypothetical protein [Ramlibacter pinisoli]
MTTLQTRSDVQIILESALTCPNCGHVSTEVMPENACVYFHQCTHCQAVLRPKPGHCCVFCSYGTVACPPVQVSGGCCGSSLRDDAAT